MKKKFPKNIAKVVELSRNNSEKGVSKESELIVPALQAHHSINQETAFNNSLMNIPDKFRQLDNNYDEQEQKLSPNNKSLDEKNYMGSLQKFTQKCEESEIVDESEISQIPEKNNNNQFKSEKIQIDDKQNTNITKNINQIESTIKEENKEREIIPKNPIENVLSQKNSNTSGTFLGSTPEFDSEDDYEYSDFADLPEKSFSTKESVYVGKDKAAFQEEINSGQRFESELDENTNNNSEKVHLILLNRNQVMDANNEDKKNKENKYSSQEYKNIELYFKGLNPESHPEIELESKEKLEQIEKLMEILSTQIKPKKSKEYLPLFQNNMKIYPSGNIEELNEYKIKQSNN